MKDRQKHAKKARRPKVQRTRRQAASGEKQSSVGSRILEGLEQAVAWSRGEEVPVHVTIARVPEVDLREVRRQMGLSQTEFAMKFGFPPATLRNWQQGRVRPDAPTRVLPG